MPPSSELTLLPGARALLALHARELPQRDDLCGAFCGTLALGAAGVEGADGAPLDQDAVALAAGTLVSLHADPRRLPRGEAGRRGYRLPLPFVEDASVSGTTAAGVVRAIEELSGGALAALPFSGPWTAETLDGLFDAAASSERPAALIANLATRHLWGGRPRADQVLDRLYGGGPGESSAEGASGDSFADGASGGPSAEGTPPGPPADWDVGHFVSVFGKLRGPCGSLYGVADTYPALGARGIHMQPSERLAAAIDRGEGPGGPEGGVVVVVFSGDAPRVRARARALGLENRTWNNGSLTAEEAAA
jgi:hypothetical protein